MFALIRLLNKITINWEILKIMNIAINNSLLLLTATASFWYWSI